jgi:hypothetical protein
MGGHSTISRANVTAAGSSMVRRRWKPVPYRPSRLDPLVAVLGGPEKMARYFGVHRVTAYRWRTGEYVLTTAVAEKMRTLALELSAQLNALAFELKGDAAAGRERTNRQRARGANKLFEMRERRARAGQ